METKCVSQRAVEEMCADAEERLYLPLRRKCPCSPKDARLLDTFARLRRALNEGQAALDAARDGVIE